MNKKLKVFLLIIGITTFILTFLWLASFAFRLFMSGGSEGFLRTLFKGNLVLNPQVRSHPLDIIFYQWRYGDQYEGALKGAWWLSAIFHFSLIVLVSKILSKKPKLYGDARFATVSEISKAQLLIPMSEVKQGGLFAGTRIIVGRIGRQFIALREGGGSSYSSTAVLSAFGGRLRHQAGVIQNHGSVPTKMRPCRAPVQSI